MQRSPIFLVSSCKALRWIIILDIRMIFPYSYVDTSSFPPFPQDRAFFLLKTLLLVDICGFLGLAIQSPFFDPDLYSHERFPFFYRSDQTKEQMIVDLVSKSNVLLWSGVALGSIAIGILVFAAVRY